MTDMSQTFNENIKYINERSVNMTRVTKRLNAEFEKFTAYLTKIAGEDLEKIYYKETNPAGKTTTWKLDREASDDCYYDRYKVIAFNSTGLWILQAHAEFDAFPTPNMRNAINFNTLNLYVKKKLVKKLPAIIEYFAQEIAKQVETNESLQNSLERFTALIALIPE
jgi:hypothetical protein